MSNAHYDQLLQMLESGYMNRNSPSTNLRTPKERGWWLNTIPEDRADGGPVGPGGSSSPTSEFATPGDLQRARISQAFGWDVGDPLREFLLNKLPQLSFPVIPHGVTAWAGRTPGIVRGIETLAPITGGSPNSSLPMRDAITLDLTPITESSAGLRARFPRTLQRTLGTPLPDRGANPPANDRRGRTALPPLWRMRNLDPGE
jgi:hypothetical protein